MKRLRMILSSILILTLLSAIVPLDLRTAVADESNDSDDFTVTEITIKTDFDSAQVKTGMSITIHGTNLLDAEVLGIKSGEPVVFGRPAKRYNYLLSFEFKTKAELMLLEGIEEIMVNGSRIPFADKGQMPTISWAVRG